MWCRKHAIANTLPPRLNEIHRARIFMPLPHAERKIGILGSAPENRHVESPLPCWRGPKTCPCNRPKAGEGVLRSRVDFRGLQFLRSFVGIEEKRLAVHLAFGDIGKFGDEIYDLFLEDRRADFRLGLGIGAEEIE